VACMTSRVSIDAMGQDNSVQTAHSIWLWCECLHVLFSLSRLIELQSHGEDRSLFFDSGHGIE